MLNSMAAGRRLARRVVVSQVIATLVLAALLLVFGVQHGLGALVGGGALVVGNGVMAWYGFRHDAPGAGYALNRLVIGLILKWVLAGAVLLIGMFVFPALAVLAGLLVSEVAFAIAGASDKQ